jgi:hypothetical protein
MALRIRCKCGKALKISSKLAGKKLLCPHCKNPFRITAEKFKAAEAAAKRRAAAKRGAPHRPRPPAAPPEPVRLDIQPTSLDAYVQPANLDAAWQPAGRDPATDFQFAHSGVLDDQTTDLLHPEGSIGPPVAVPVGPPEPAAVGYAGEASKRESYRQNVGGDAIQAPQRGFWADAFGAFVFPVMNKENAVTFGIIALVVSLPTLLTALIAPLGFIGFPLAVLAFLIGFLVFFWVLALYLSVVLDTAAGSDDLPTFRMDNGIIEDVLVPAFKFVGALLIVFLPGILLSMFLAFGAVPGWLGFLVPVWLVVGAFFIPMSLILFSFSAQSMLLRPDLVFLTIIRTILPYLSVWLMLLLVLTARMAATSSALLAKVGLGQIIPDLTELGVVGGLVLQAIETYLMIVSMRIVGLYYLHFKKRFAIVME